MSDESAPPAAPADYLTSHQSRAAYEAQLRGHFGGRPAQDPHGNLKAFEQEMQATGVQRADAPLTGDVDQRALDYLDEWRSKHPRATNAELAVYERDLASVLEGRRMGETFEAFQARKASGQPAATPTTPTAGADGGGFVEPAAIPAESLHGYQMPDGLPAGVTVHAESLAQHLAAARAAGISQQQVAVVIRQLAAQAK